MKLWGSGSRANLQLECQNGQAFIKFSSQLGTPGDHQFTPNIPHHGPHEAPQHGPHEPQHFPRHRGPKQRERDRARAAAHRAKFESQSNAPGDPAAATATVPSPDSADKSQDPLPGAAAVVAPSVVVEDEVCPNTEYANADSDDIGSDGKTAFRCFQCRMLYLPDDHRDRNHIMNYEHCRRHMGVFKCESCAKVIVGLARIRCHRQVCQDPA